MMKRSFNLTKNKNMYSIRKYHFGAAGVLLGASLALGTGTALAEEQGVTTTTPNTALTTETSVQPTETAVTPVITEPLITADPVTTESEAEESITSEAGAPVLASSPTETVTESITPSNVAISISGTDRNNQPIADQSVIQQGTIMTVGLSMDLPDAIVTSGDTLSVALPEYLAVSPSPFKKDITDEDNTVVGTLELLNNRAEDGTFINTTGQLTFTDAYKGKFNNTLSFSFPVQRSSLWPNEEFRELTAIVANQEVSSGMSVQLRLPTSPKMSQSHTMYYRSSEPEYTLHEGAEVSVKSTSDDTSVTVVYKIAEDTLDYARYDVTKIREEGFNVRMGEDRSYQTGTFNTLTNDRGITATVDEEGTTVTVTVPTLLAGNGLGMSFIPLLLTDTAIAEADNTRVYNTVMEVYPYTLNTVFDPNQEPIIANYYATTYPFTPGGASSKAVSLIVSHRVGDSNGPLLEERSISQVLIDDTYTTSPGNFDGYKLIETPTNATGTVTKEVSPILVTYIYGKVGSDVIVKYQDEQGNTLQPDVVDTSNEVIGAAYDTTDHKDASISYNGATYLLVEDDYSNEIGHVGETPILVVYKYTPQLETITETKDTTLTVHYQGAGDKTPADKIVSVSWTRQVQKNPVTGEIVVGSETPWTSDTSTYPTVITPEVEHYTADKTQVADELASPTDSNRIVVVTYTPNPQPVIQEEFGTVIVRYVDTEGNPIKADVVDTPTTLVSKTVDGQVEAVEPVLYYTVDHKPSTIIVNEQTYQLVPKATQGNEFGLVTVGTTIVTYVYQLVSDETPEVPETPEMPNSPSTPRQVNQTVFKTSNRSQGTYQPNEVNKQPVTEYSETGKVNVLPNTGEADSAILTALGIFGLVTSYGLGKKKRKEN